MGSSWCIASFSGRKKADFKTTGTVFLDSSRLSWLIESVDNRRDEPEDLTFGWIEPVDYEEGEPFEQAISVNNLFSPERVLASLDWLMKLADAGDSAIQEECAEYSREPYSPKVFRAEFGYDIDQVRSLCTQARARGDRIATFIVP